jgi:folate-binding protein YgfZ
VNREIVEALEAGTAFVDLSSWRKVGVAGSEALSWLNDLVSADIDDIGPGRARRALLLSPTGGVRAEFTVAVHGGSILLIQDPAQPRSILDLLAPYVLSSDVELDDRTAELALFAFPNRTTAPDAAGSAPSTPSCVGPGADMIVLSEDHDRIAEYLGKTLLPAGSEELEAWRVAAGVPRVGVDVAEDDLPQEGALTDAVSFDKGCFLGQEAVAKVRNLGHPRRLLLPVEADAPLGRGDGVYSDGTVVGTITSADGTRALAKVRWASREGPFRTADGAELRVRT